LIGDKLFDASEGNENNTINATEIRIPETMKIP